MRKVEHFDEAKFDFIVYKDKIQMHHDKKFNKLQQILDSYQYWSNDFKEEDENKVDISKNDQSMDDKKNDQKHENDVENESISKTP